MLRVTVSFSALVLIVATGCRSTAPEATGTALAPGDLLYGRLPADRELQAFSFEGVEGSLLDFDVRADGGDIAAPSVELVDPEGRTVDIASAMQSPEGAASMSVRGVVLLRNGIHKVSVRPPREGQSTWYRFSHALRFPPIQDSRVTLTAEESHPIFVSAPRGGLIAFRVKPEAQSDVVPEIRAVKDPWGGRALDKSRIPQGAPPPRVSRTFEGGQVLTFTAPGPGRYTILTAARPGTRGVVSYSAQVRPPAGAQRIVYHPNTPPHFGVPGNLHGTGAKAPGEAPRAAPARPGVPPPPAPPSAPVRRVAPPPITPLPPDPSLAQR